MAIILGILLILLLGVAPMLLYALILWWFDRYEKEPVGLLIAAFLWGAAPAVVFSVIAELILDIPISRFVAPVGAVAADLLGVAVVAPIAEEVFKGAALLLLFIFFRHEIDSPLDGVIYGGLVGFGFATVENVLYFAGAFVESGFEGLLLLSFFRAVLFGLNHALFTGLTGLGLAFARTAMALPVKLGAPVVGLGAGMLTHAIHNGSVTLGAMFCWPCIFAFISDWGGVLLLLAVMLWATARERQWIVEFLTDEVERGVLTREDYRQVSSYIERVAARLGALLRGDFRRWWNLGRYYQAATELAFNKRRLALFPGEADTLARVNALRGRVIFLGQQVR